jgi:arylsulfatase A-like enzyme
MAAPTNLVLITVDCLRADALGAYGAAPSPSPFLDDLAAHSWVAERAITAGLPTYYAFQGIHASRFPLTFGRDTVGLLPTEPTLASTLAAAGFSTAAFVAGNPYLARRERYDQGFETYEDFLEGGPPKAEMPRGGHPLRGLRRMLEEAARRHPVSHRLFQELLFQVWARRHTRKPLDPAALRSYPAADQIVDTALPWLERQGTEGGRPFSCGFT